MEIVIKRQRAKRYGWLRLYNDFSGHPLWRLIAMEAQVSLGDVESIVIRILISANKGKPRGSIADFSCNRAAADLGINPSEVVRTYQALEQNGWIEKEYLTAWDDRQPDKEDGTNAQRQARYRSKRRQERGIIEESNAVTSVTVTPKTQTKTKQEASIRKLATGQTVTWKELQESGYVPPRQRSLPLPPVPLKKKGVGR